MSEIDLSKLPTDRPGDFLYYAQVVATPKALRSSASMPLDSSDFSRVYGIARSTLNDWTHKPEFQQLVRNNFSAWAKTKSPEVNHSLYKRAIQYGKADEVKLWNQMFEGFNEKTESKLEVSGSLTLSSWLQDESTTIQGENETSASLVH